MVGLRRVEIAARRCLRGFLLRGHSELVLDNGVGLRVVWPAGGGEQLRDAFPLRDFGGAAFVVGQVLAVDVPVQPGVLERGLARRRTELRPAFAWSTGWRGAAAPGAGTRGRPRDRGAGVLTRASQSSRERDWISGRCASGAAVTDRAIAVVNSARLKLNVEPLNVPEFHLQARATATALTEIGVRDGLRDRLVQVGVRRTLLLCRQDEGRVGGR